ALLGHVDRPGLVVRDHPFDDAARAQAPERANAGDPPAPGVDELPLLDDGLLLGTRERVEPPVHGTPVEREAIVLAGQNVVVVHAREQPGRAIDLVDPDLARLAVVERDDVSALATEREV